MKRLYIIVILLSFSAKAQIINFPDANLKNALVNTLCVRDIIWGVFDSDADTNNDGEIDMAEAAAVEGLKLSNQNIASLAGLENFTQLRYLDCSYNLFTTLTVTAFPYLHELNCSHNQLTALNFDLDNASIYDIKLDCSYNALTTIAIPGGIYDSLDFGFNQFTTFSASGIYAANLNLSGNLFAAFDDATIQYVENLGLANCPFLTSAKIKSDSAGLVNNPALVSLQLGSHGQYAVHNNPVLLSIDLKDGSCGFIDGDFPDPQFNFTNNPSLEFVCVDDLGLWYEESTSFFQSEIEFVQVSPGVNKTFYCDLLPGGGYNTLSGTIHYDCVGANLALDNQDVKINIDQNSNGTIEGTTNPDNTGAFVFYTSGSGSIAPVFESNYFTVTPSSESFNFSGSGNTQNVDFCVSPNGTHPDLEIAIIPIVPARPGFDAVYKIVYINKGTTTQSGSVSLTFEDDRTDLVLANPTVDSQVTNVLTWNFTGLQPFESREINLTLNVNSPLEIPSVNIDDVLDFTASLTTLQTDETPADITNVLMQVVVGSLDPNDKAVSRFSIPPTELNQYLYYTVRFQNTGTFYAENVVIRDMLSKNLDLNSFEVVATSHACRSKLVRQNSGSEGDKLEFVFEGIELPAAQNDEPASHGYVTFKIKPKSTLVIGDVIENEAGIYFDFNAPIVTNTVTTTVTALGTDDFSTMAFNLYPNPAKNRLTIASENAALIQRISIYNMLGQLVRNVTPDFENGSMSIDVSALDNGTYLIRVASENGVGTRKLIKL